MTHRLLSYCSCLALAGFLAGCDTVQNTATGETGTESTKILATPEAQKEAIKPTPSHQVTVTLGEEQTLKVLYSYPNKPDSQETLSQTIEHYLNQRLSRDLIPNASAKVAINSDGVYEATLSGNSANIEDYQLQISTFLANGQEAANAVTSLKENGIWNNEEWRFFLPLGLSIVNQRSVQLLHFPPDYSLPDQDYLDSKTSQRWEKLLELNSVPSSEVTLYESILDVAPIAAPASAGGTLSDTYSYFEPYVVDMLPLLLDIDEGSTSALPIVAYGGPVRSWVKSHYNLSDFGVNTFDSVQITDSVAAPILGANHPSYIWYAKDNGRAAAMKVMQQDLVSACWQARMGQSPSSDGSTVLGKCNSYWAEKPMEVCINMEIQAYNKTEQQAEEICENNIPDSDTQENLAGDTF